VLESRPKDFSRGGLNRWTFSVLAFWGESPKGNFTIDIFDTVNAQIIITYYKLNTIKYKINVIFYL
jgi:subtilisin-like proprotein convertase family protein